MIQWPTDLPLPMITPSGTPQNATLASDPTNYAVIQRRARYRFATVAMKVSFNFDISGYDEFFAFWLNTLGNGTAYFQISLKYPKQSELTDWIVRFIGKFQADYNDSCWTVTANIEMLRKANLKAAMRVGYQGFLVKQPQFIFDETKDVPFFTSDGFQFCVKASA